MRRCAFINPLIAKKSDHDRRQRQTKLGPWHDFPRDPGPFFITFWHDFLKSFSKPLGFRHLVTVSVPFARVADGWGHFASVIAPGPPSHLEKLESVVEALLDWN